MSHLTIFIFFFLCCLAATLSTFIFVKELTILLQIFLIRINFVLIVSANVLALIISWILVDVFLVVWVLGFLIILIAIFIEILQRFLLFFLHLFLAWLIIAKRDDILNRRIDVIVEYTLSYCFVFYKFQHELLRNPLQSFIIQRICARFDKQFGELIHDILT